MMPLLLAFSSCILTFFLALKHLSKRVIGHITAAIIFTVGSTATAGESYSLEVIWGNDREAVAIINFDGVSGPTANITSWSAVSDFTEHGSHLKNGEPYAELYLHPDWKTRPNPIESLFLSSRNGNTLRANEVMAGTIMHSYVFNSVKLKDNSTPDVVDATLASVEFSVGSLSPVFDKDAKSYTLTVPHDATSISLSTVPSSVDTAVTAQVSNSQNNLTGPDFSLTPESFPVVVDVMSSSTSDSETYNFLLNVLPRPISSDARLLAMSRHEKTSISTFGSQFTISYHEAGDRSSVVLSGKTRDERATLTIMGRHVVSGVPETFDLLPGHNRITYIVTAEDGVTTFEDWFTIIRPLSSNATLSNLTTSASALQPAFSEEITDYSIGVANDVSFITISPVSEYLATITVNGSNVSSGASSGEIALSYGENEIEVHVRSQNNSVLKTYFISVTRAMSSDATLSGLSSSEGVLSPEFSSGVLHYKVLVDEDVETIKILPGSDHEGAIEVNGTSVVSDSQSQEIDLAYGLNELEVVVTSQDGSVLETYVIDVTRKFSSDWRLAIASFETGDLSPAFDPVTRRYTMVVGNDVAETYVDFSTVSPFAKAVLLGVQEVSSGRYGPIQLDVGENIISIDVEAANGDSGNYVFSVTREASSEAGLENISLSTGDLTFDPVRTHYEVDVSHDVTEVSLTATTIDQTAQVSVNGVQGLSGEPSGTLMLPVGETLLTVNVTAQDEVASSIYTVLMRRAASDDASLGEISVSSDSGDLVPAFSPENYDYTMLVPNSVSTFTLTPVVSDSGARLQVTLNGNAISSFGAHRTAPLARLAGPASHEGISVPLEVGENIVQMSVLAADGQAQRDYRVVVTREASADASLSSILLSDGDLSPAFSSEIHGYEVTLPHEVQSVRITAYAAHDQARIEVNGQMVASGEASEEIEVTVGQTQITIMVLAEDGVTETVYSVAIARDSSAAWEFEQHKEEVRDIIRTQAVQNTRTHLSASMKFSRQARDRAIDNARMSQSNMVARAKPLSWDGVLKAGDSGSSAQGYLTAVGLTGDWTRLFFTHVDLTRSEEGITTGSVSARLAHENQISDRSLIGFYFGVDADRSTISSSFEGDGDAIEVSYGVYGVRQMHDSVWVNGFMSYGVGRSNLDMNNGTLFLDGRYHTRSLLVGGAVTGSIEMEKVEIRPDIEISHGRTRVGEVSFDAQAFGDSDRVSLDAGLVQLTRLQVTPEIHVPFMLGQYGVDSKIVVSPRGICEWSKSATSTENCGAGFDLGVKALSLDGLTDVSANAGFEKVGTNERLSIGLDFNHRF